jgi:hypothetical protein
MWEKGGRAMDPVLRALMVSAPRLLGLSNVVGVGKGHKHVHGESTGKPALTVLVRRKLPREELSARDVVPESVEDADTDVIEVGDVVALGSRPDVSRTARYRPAMPGVSIGHYKITAGTFGAVVYDRNGGAPLILSNNHVLANCSNGKDGRARPGDHIWQPGKYDGGTDRDTIATLLRFVPVSLEVAAPECPVAAAAEKGLNRVVKWFRKSYGVKFYKMSGGLNLVDAAVAKPLNDADLEKAIVGIGVPNGTAEVSVDDKVRKSGRTSGLNSGTVKVVQATIKIGMGDAGDAVFSDQVVVTQMAQPGDSGSLVVNERNQAVGLLSAGSDTVSIFGRIKNICDALSVRM